MALSFVSMVSHAKPSADEPGRGGGLSPFTFDERYVFQGDASQSLSWTADESGDMRYLSLSVQENGPRANEGLRAEIMPKREYVQEGVRVYGISFKLPADWETAPVPILLAQLHTSQKHDRVSPPLAVVARGDRLLLETRSSTARPSLGERLTKDNVRHTVRDLGPLPLGRWTCFVFRMNWSFRAKQGESQIWMNGKPILDERGEPNAYETWLGNYPKVGLYAPWKLGARERHILVDGIWLGVDGATMQDIYRLTPCGSRR